MPSVVCGRTQAWQCLSFIVSWLCSDVGVRNATAPTLTLPRAGSGTGEGSLVSSACGRTQAVHTLLFSVVGWLCSLLCVPCSPSYAASVRAIRQITTPEMTRLVIELSEPASYRLIPFGARHEYGTPERLHFEILDTQVDPRLGTFALAEGPVVRVRATQASARMARLVLDAPGMTAFGAFWMTNPFRLIIDVRGPARRGPARPNVTAIPTPPVARSKNAPVRVTATPSPTRQTAAPEPTPRRWRIVIDAGHGGIDSGAIGAGGIAEKDAVLSIALLLKSRLASARNIDVILTRQTDAFLRLEERTARANAEKADLFISIHANASTNPEARGVETYYLNNTNDRATLRLAAMENGLRAAVGQGMDNPAASLILSDLIQNFKVQESARLAEMVQKALIAELETRGTPTHDLGVKRGPFYVLVGAGMPCVLAEVSFVTHASEGARLGQRSYQETIADGLLRGIRQFVENAGTTGNL